MTLEKRYKDYYKELFRVHSSEFFNYINGDNYSEYDEGYSELCEKEFEDLAIDFSNTLTFLTMNNIEITEDMVVLKLIEYMNILCNKKGLENINIKNKGTHTLAKLMVTSINKRIGMNYAKHPLVGEEVIKKENNVSYVVDKPYYVLLQDNGYYLEEVNLRAIAVSDYESKLKDFCDKQIDKILKLPRFKNFKEREDLTGAYRQLVDDSKQLRLTWRIEEVKGV